MKRFTVPCLFGEQKAPFHLYVAAGPAPGCHPLKYQAHWLLSERGGFIPQEVLDSFGKLFQIAEENNTDFEALCMYALEQQSPAQATALTSESEAAAGPG